MSERDKQCREALYFAVMRMIALQQTSDYSPTISVVSEQLGVDYRRTVAMCLDMSSDSWDYHTDSGHPWLCIHRDTVRVTTDGQRALCDARGNPWVNINIQAWITQHRWPWREEDSRQRAVIPTGGTVHGRRPGEPDRLAGDRKDLIAQGLAKGEIRYCRRCADAGRWPYRPIEMFRVRGGKAEGSCADCEAERKRQRRTK